MVKSSIQWKRLINEGEPPSGQVITTSLSVTKNKSLILTARFRDKAITLHRNLPSVAEMPLDTDVYYCDWRSTRSLCSLINVLQCRLPDQYEELINCESGLRIPPAVHITNIRLFTEQCFVKMKYRTAVGEKWFLSVERSSLPVCISEK